MVCHLGQEHLSLAFHILASHSCLLVLSPCWLIALVSHHLLGFALDPGASPLWPDPFRAENGCRYGGDVVPLRGYQSGQAAGRRQEELGTPVESARGKDFI